MSSSHTPITYAHVQAMQLKARRTREALQRALPAAQQLEAVLTRAVLGDATLKDVQDHQGALDTALMEGVNAYGDIQTVMDTMRILDEVLEEATEDAPLH